MKAFIIAEANNENTDIQIVGIATSPLAAQDALKNAFRRNCCELEGIFEKSITRKGYSIRLKNGGLVYGQLLETEMCRTPATLRSWAAATLAAPDSEERCTAFYQAFAQAAYQDDGKPAKEGTAMLQALLDDDVVSFSVAACGWSPSSILERTNLVRDTYGMCLTDPVPAMFFVYHGKRVEESRCLVDPKTHRVFDFSDNCDPNGKTVTACRLAYNMQLYHVIPAAQLAEHDVVSFWYE